MPDINNTPPQENRPQGLNSLARYRIISVLLLFLLLFIFGKILNIMIVEGDRWRAKAETIHRPELVQVNPIRGNIYARDGRVVAVTAPYYRLYFDFQAQAFNSVSRDSMNTLLDTLAYHISKKFSTPERAFKASDLTKKWREGIKRKSRYWPVYPYDISYLQLQELYQLPPLCRMPNKKGRLSVGPIPRSIIKEEKSSRMDPFGSLASRTIGEVYGEKQSGLSHGRNGLELSYDNMLKGKTGQAIRIYSAGKYNLNTIVQPEKGYDVYTTLDMDRQSIVETSLKDKLIDADAQSGTAILMDVATGEVIAITNLQRISTGKYAETLNYGVADMSEPGSTFKVASIMVALDDGVCAPDDIVDVGNGLWKLSGRVVRDHNAHRGGYGKITVSQAIQYSSNVGVAKIIVGHYSDNPDRYVEKIRKLGFGYDLKLEIPGAGRARVRKRADNKDGWYGTTLGWMSYGYETQVPPIYMLAFYNAIANDGKFVRPYFVTKVMNKGEIVKENKPTVLNDSICKPSTLREVREMLRDVVSKGTGKPADSPIVSISGKTGTAQLSQGKSGYKGAGGVMHQVSFCGYFPSEHPKYSCIVVIRNPKVGYPGGGSMAGPVVRTIAEKLYSMEAPIPIDQMGRDSLGRRINMVEKLNISSGYKPDIAGMAASHKLPVKQDSKLHGNWVVVRPTDRGAVMCSMPVYPKGVMPNVINMAPADAAYLLQKKGLKPIFKGYGPVAAQSISAGTRFNPGDKVIIYLKNDSTIE